MTNSQETRPTTPRLGHMPDRIAVVGTTGSGKTIFARQVAKRLGIPHIELDSLHWDPGWTAVETQEFRSRVAHALSVERWVVDGNYSVVRDIVWGRATMLVWLDYSFPLTFWRLGLRTMRRIVTREAIWNGNRESARNALLSRDSIFVWLFKTYRKKRREYPALFKQPQYAHLRLCIYAPLATPVCALYTTLLHYDAT